MMTGPRDPASDTGLTIWRAREPKTLLLVGSVLLAIAVRDIAGVVEFFHRTDTGHPDFYGLWTFARFAAERPAIDIYNPALLQAFQSGLDPDFNGFYPFAYPPSMLLLLAPLAGLGFGAARTAFVLASLALFVPVVVWFARARGVLATAVALVALTAPATVYAVFIGQNGLLFGALLLGGLLALEGRPVLAGCLFGLLSCKPQFGLLLPFALLGMGAWRAIVATVTAIAALVLVTAMAYGWGIWLAWLATLPDFSARFTAQLGGFLPLMASPAAGLVRLNLGPGAAMAVQAIISLTLAAMIWLLFRRAPIQAAAAALLPAVGLASPYAFIYDQPVVVACLAWLFVDRDRRDAAFGIGELLVLLAALLAPAFLLHPAVNLPVVTASLVALFVVAARHAWNSAAPRRISLTNAPKTGSRAG